MSKELLGHIQQLEEHLRKGRFSLLKLTTIDMLGYDASYIISNAELMTEVLGKTFRHSRKLDYLPRTIIDSFTSTLVDINGQFAGIPESNWEGQDPAVAKNVLDKLDRMYATCLQYGLISFGFEGKEAQTRIDEFRSHIDTAESLDRRLNRTLRDAEGKVESNVQSTLEAIASELNQVREELTQRQRELAPNIAAVNENVDRAKTGAEEIARLVDATKSVPVELQAVKVSAEESARLLSEELQTIKSNAEGLLGVIQTAEKQAREAMTTAKSSETSAIEARAAVADQLEQIRMFTAAVEKYKQEMTDTQRNTDAEMARIKNEIIHKVNDFGERTESIITSNEGLIAQIRNTLQKAVGASLFTAFDKRRDRIFKGSIVWGIFLAVSVVGALIYARWFVTELGKDGSHTSYGAFVLARLLFAAPLAFLISFCATQYSKERRAEEEYAFKSTISVSLEAFRDLLKRASAEDPNVDLSLIKTMVKEIFQNPMNRLYVKPAKNSSNDESDQDASAIQLVEKIVELVAKNK